MNKDYFAEEAKYISANVASQKTGYAQDHIGALIRTGKIKGKKIGRSWFVDLETLKEHKKNRKLKNGLRIEKPIPEIPEPKSEIPSQPILNKPFFKYENEDKVLIPEISK